jgi:hypothetical protein
VAFISAWFNREGTSAQNNPMATTQNESGATTFNSVGVKNYPTEAEGIAATITTLQNGLYGDIVNALKTGTANVSTDYQGLHNWSAGPQGAQNKGYWNLSGVSTDYKSRRRSRTSWTSPACRPTTA